ncbi:MAG TPA: hypothetical protein VFW05_17815 [Verrucomicrobiae bacterium]|nr:hypothetical protein [Verrucomicrobiae bacterium]
MGAGPTTEPLQPFTLVLANINVHIKGTKWMYTGESPTEFDRYVLKKLSPTKWNM